MLSSLTLQKLAGSGFAFGVTEIEFLVSIVYSHSLYCAVLTFFVRFPRGVENGISWLLVRLEDSIAVIPW